eukprot:9488844-Pyramimonas_sp.AAC.3
MAGRACPRSCRRCRRRPARARARRTRRREPRTAQRCLSGRRTISAPWLQARWGAVESKELGPNITPMSLKGPALPRAPGRPDDPCCSRAQDGFQDARSREPRPPRCAHMPPTHP